MCSEGGLERAALGDADPLPALKDQIERAFLVRRSFARADQRAVNPAWAPHAGRIRGRLHAFVKGGGSAEALDAMARRVAAWLFLRPPI